MRYKLIQSGTFGSKLNPRLSQMMERNCKKVRWQVLHWNTMAMEVCKKRGAVDNDVKIAVIIIETIKYD
jgi:hypothetical protein